MQIIKNNNKHLKWFVWLYISVDYIYYIGSVSIIQDFENQNKTRKNCFRYLKPFVNTCTFHNPFQFWYNSNGLEQTHSGYFRSSCSQFTIIVITLVHCLQIFAFMKKYTAVTVFFYISLCVQSWQWEWTLFGQSLRQ
jgi:hypothetical protein